MSVRVRGVLAVSRRCGGPPISVCRTSISLVRLCCACRRHKSFRYRPVDSESRDSGRATLARRRRHDCMSRIRARSGAAARPIWSAEVVWRARCDGTSPHNPLTRNPGSRRLAGTARAMYIQIYYSLPSARAPRKEGLAAAASPEHVCDTLKSWATTPSVRARGMGDTASTVRARARRL